jgi:hypothetical protein
MEELIDLQRCELWPKIQQMMLGIREEKKS